LGHFLPGQKWKSKVGKLPILPAHDEPTIAGLIHGRKKEIPSHTAEELYNRRESGLKKEIPVSKTR
jgi:hypothetical protein